MGVAQREWAERKRDELREELGGCCKVCGTRRKLEFDCIIPQGDKHHKMEWSWRISFYRAQHRTGNLQLLCKKHHELKSVADKKKLAA